METEELKAPSKRSNGYAISAIVFAISGWVFLVYLLWEYAAFAATTSAIILSIVAIFKKQNKLLAITGGIIALVLFIGMIFPWIMYRE
jgi:hypothetical protein